MTDLCQATGKRKLSPEQARIQVKHSVRSVNCHRCKMCGGWHVSSVGDFRMRAEKRRLAEVRDKRTEPMENEE